MEKVQRIFIKLLLFIIAMMLLFFFQGKTKETNLTLEETIESFEQYERIVQDFLAQPTKGGIAEVVQSAHKFLSNNQTLIEHQTLYNRAFGIGPLLTKKELESIQDLGEIYQKLDEQYVTAAIQDVLKATDFTLLIAAAKEKGEYISDSINIRKTGDRSFGIDIQGSFNIRDTDTLLTRYFIIETESGNYYWKKSGDFSMSYTNRELFLEMGKNDYEIKGIILF